MPTQTGPKAELSRLKKFIAELDSRYIAPHWKAPGAGGPPAPVPRLEELDVAAFAVLAHGAFENFIEGISLWAIDRIERDWIYKKRSSRSLAAFLLHQAYEANHAEETRGVYDILRSAIEDAKSEHSGIVAENNGTDIKHLRTLLSPVGIDIPTDAVLTGSLDTLIKMRHQWAHQNRFGAKTPKSANEARTAATDCLEFAEKLCKNATSIGL